MKKVFLITILGSFLLFFGGNGLTSEIHNYSYKGNYKKTLKMLKENPNLVNQRDSKGFTPLHYAVMRGNKEVVTLLLIYKADIYVTAQDGLTPLHIAARYGKSDIAKLLIHMGADINIRDTNGKTPLSLANQNNNIKTAVVLLYYGGNY